jgi:3-oxoacyl-[acyl-carrier protein] reductase
MAGRLDGKVVIVTGGSSGIGRATSLKMAGEGAKIVVADVNADGGEGSASLVRDAGAEATFVQTNVTEPEGVEAMVAHAMETFGRIDVLVNNAGITRDNLLMRMKEEEWDAVLNVNLKAAFLCTKAVCRPMMKARSGRIINIASVVGLMGNAGQANYSASKAGIIGLTKTTARELAARNITSNAVAPGFIDTDMTKKLSEEVRERLMTQIPLGVLGQAEDVAAAVAFLASADAAYITGQVIVVDGGMVM